MSQYITDENGNQAQVATNLGWSEFCEWAEPLDLEDFFEVRHLVEHGWERDLGPLAKQLKIAVATAKPCADVRDVALGLVKFLEAHKESEIITIGNGMVDDDAPVEPGALRATAKRARGKKNS